MTCTIGDLAAGAQAARTINVTAPPSAGSITNNVAIDGNEVPDPQPANNTASATTIVRPPVILSSIAVIPANVSLDAGHTVQLIARASYSDGTQQDVTAQSVWTTSASGAATVNSSGLVTAVTAGSATITATVGSVSGTATVTVTNPPPTIISLIIVPAGATVDIGATLQLRAQATYSDNSTQDVTAQAIWTSSATDVAAVSSAGVVQARVEGTTTIGAGVSGLTATAMITVSASPSLPPDPASVAPAIDPTVVTSMYDATTFLYSGTSPIQTGVVSGTIERRRVAVLRGSVLARGGAVLGGVKISIVDHPEFGQTFSRTDGKFDLAVNGGGALVIRYEKNGYLPLQRQADTPWRDYVVIPEVVMIPYDSAVTMVDLAATSLQTARGSVIQDADGTRRATLVVIPGTVATMTLPDGTTQQLAALHIRATEYTVGSDGPKAMPAQLPPTSGYTYCVELSADEATAAGADNVTFSKPLVSYTEDFLHFPVGGIVPVGWYDRRKGQWIPSDNGRIIKVLGITAGLADLDVDGSNTPANATALFELGISDAERVNLAALYAPGQSLWRALVDHFTPFDFNWAFAPPPTAQAPKQPPPKTERSLPNSCSTKGSIIECENQVLGDSIVPTGTSFSLEYRSNRAEGRKSLYTAVIPLTGDTPPVDSVRVDLIITIAGQTTAVSFPPYANQSFTYQWNGRDAYGRRLYGRQTASISIGYVYKAQYQEPYIAARSFAMVSGSPILNPARQEFTIWQKSLVTFEMPAKQLTDLGGWTLSNHHYYDPFARVLHLGSGEVRLPEVRGPVVTRVAGTGCGASDAQPPRDGVQALETTITTGCAIATGADGSIYFTDTCSGGARVWRIDRQGTVRLVAGTNDPTAGTLDDGVPATNASFGSIFSLVATPQGELLIADKGSSRVRKVRRDGIIVTVAGNGTFGNATDGDGGPATSAAIDPRIIALGADGSLYILGDGARRLRRVGTDGIITTVAGVGFVTGLRTGDGGPASKAEIGYGEGMIVGDDGSIVMSFNSHNIRRIRQDGIIETVAGSDTPGFFGDGGTAVFALLSVPRGLAFGLDGSLYVGEAGNLRIRHITRDGLIGTVAGTGAYPPAPCIGERGYALAASLDTGRISATPDGTLYVLSGTAIHKISGINDEETAVPSDSGEEVYIFRQDGRHLRTVSSRTNAIIDQFNDDPAGYLRSVTDADGNVTLIERDGAGAPIAIVAPGGQRTTLQFDGGGYLASVSSPASETTRMSYTSDGLLLSLSDRRGGTHHFTYDDDGRLLEDENPAAGFQLFSRSTNGENYVVTRGSAMGRHTTYAVQRLPGGLRRTITNPSGLSTVSVVGDDGTTAITSPDGTVTSVTETPEPRFGVKAPLSTATVHLPSGLTMSSQESRTAVLSNPFDPLSLTSESTLVTINGNEYRSNFDVASLTATTTSPTGRQSFTVFNGKGHPVGASMPGLTAVAFAYDLKGRLTDVTQGARSTSLSYDAANRLTSITDPLLRTTHFDYDLADRVTIQTLPDGRAIGFTYDGNGNVTSITPPSRPAHAFTFTPVDLTESYTPPAVSGSGGTRYTYNLDEQPTAITRPDGSAVRLDYDTGGRLSSVMAARGRYTYAYDAGSGNVASVTAPDGGSISYQYDGFLPTITTWAGSVAGTIARTYDSQFRITSTNVNGTGAISYGYDADGLLTSAGALTLTRDAHNGFLTGTTIGNLTDAWTYNAFGEPLTYAASGGTTPIFSQQYTRDDAGRITRRTDRAFGTTITDDYGYDSAGRLAQVTRDGVLEASYTYDPNSNRITRTTSSATENGTYDEQDRLLTYHGATFTYTPNGELATKNDASGTTSYGYDEMGNLLRVTMPSGTVIEYVTDGQNRRVGKKVNGTLVKGWLYNGQLQVAAELDGTGAVVSRFVYGSRPNVPDYVIKGGITYRIISDHLGSPRIVTDTATGTVAETLGYDEFGSVLAAPSALLPFGFAGGLYDSDTKLLRFGARDYDPTTGRWTAKDPIGFAGEDTNLYGYVLADPVNNTDPFGLWRLPDYVGININVAIPTPWTGTLIGWSGTASVDRYGRWYWSPFGGGVGKSATFVSGSCTANWLDQSGRPTPDALKNFLTQNGFSASAGYWGGVAQSYTPGSGWSTGVGFVSPQIGVTYNYSFQGTGSTGRRW